MPNASLLFAFVLFAAVMFFTPGPNNIMVMSSGLTFGFRRTLRQKSQQLHAACFVVRYPLKERQAIDTEMALGRYRHD